MHRDSFIPSPSRNFRQNVQHICVRERERGTLPAIILFIQVLYVFNARALFYPRVLEKINQRDRCLKLPFKTVVCCWGVLRIKSAFRIVAKESFTLKSKYRLSHYGSLRRCSSYHQSRVNERNVSSCLRNSSNCHSKRKKKKTVKKQSRLLTTAYKCSEVTRAHWYEDIIIFSGLLFNSLQHQTLIFAQGLSAAEMTIILHEQNETSIQLRTGIFPLVFIVALSNCH